MNAINPIVLPGKSFDLNTFTFNGHTLRVVVIDGKPWFITVDVCRSLGLYVKADGEVNTTMATRRLGPDEVTISPNNIGGRRPGLISESGFYKFTLRAERSNPAAREFQDWVTKEVLPRIRKDGAYFMGEEKVATGEKSAEVHFEDMAAAVTKKINAILDQLSLLEDRRQAEETSKQNICDRQAMLRAALKLNEDTIEVIHERMDAIDAEKRPLKFQIEALKSIKESLKKVADPSAYGV